MADDLLSTPPPLAPPKTSGALVCWLRLIRSHRVGVATFFRLMTEHGSAEAALQELPGIASAAGVAKYTPFSQSAAETEMEAGHRLGAKLITIGCDDYPAILRGISDPPPLLWTLGDRSLLNRPVVSLVGARNASSLGTRMAKSLAKELGELGFVVASGLARGIDTAAHLAALERGTIAVQAGGISSIYPTENARLHQDIAEQGLRISEQPIALTPQARHFPRRNRIISGIAQAVVVVEAAAKSGSLITARDALDQGRDVLAVPGHPFDARASGCNMLIRDGATLIRSGRDIAELLAISEKPPAQPATRHNATALPVDDHGDAHAMILDLLGPTPIAEDQLIRDTGLPAQSVIAHLITLEMEGAIQRQPGGLLSRCA